MWLTSWWVAWLLNFYGFSHTNCMVFYRTPWTRYGIPWNCISTSGNPMAFHGTPRYSMEFHGIPWNSITTSWISVELHGIPWNSMDTPWNSMAFHGTPWILHGTPWILLGYSMGVSWNSMDFHRFPWISMECHGGISHGMSVVWAYVSLWLCIFVSLYLCMFGCLLQEPIRLKVLYCELRNLGIYLNMTLLKVEQGQFETAILILHNFFVFYYGYRCLEELR